MGAFASWGCVGIPGADASLMLIRCGGGVDVDKRQLLIVHHEGVVGCGGASGCRGWPVRGKITLVGAVRIDRFENSSFF
jgi:hypothetical protein